MARIKRAVAAKKKRRTVMHRAKGYYGAASRTYKHAKSRSSTPCSISIVIAATRSARSALSGSPASTLPLA